MPLATVPSLWPQVEYFLPPHAASVSPEAMDLLQQILVEDPVKRRGLKEIQNHPW